MAASDWHELDDDHVVHVDLHGIFLSADFEATFVDRRYQPTAGTVWIISDGGIHWSTDGGKHFNAAQNVNTLSCVNMAGVALEGKGPAISVGIGDNDGFYSMDGGQNADHQVEAVTLAEAVAWVVGQRSTTRFISQPMS